MSIEALNYAVRLGDALAKLGEKKVTATEALLLMHLCNHVDSQWRWKSDKATLARRCITTPRTVQTGLSKFQAWGLISLVRSVGHRGQDIAGFEFWVHEDAMHRLITDPEGFFADLEEADSATEADAEAPGQDRPENSSTPESSLWITGSENSSTPMNAREEKSSTLVGVEKNARSEVENFHPQRARTSSNPHINPHSSSSSSQRYRARERFEPTAGAVGEEEPLRGASGAGVAGGSAPAASGGASAPPAQTRLPEPMVEHRLGVVAVGPVQELLATTTGAPVPVKLAEAYIGLVLDRSRQASLHDPAGFIAGAITTNPGRTRADLGTLRQQLGLEPSEPAAEAAAAERKPLCPIPAHGKEMGRYQHNCAECRGLTGEYSFPAAITPEVFDRLAQWQQRAVTACGVPVTEDATEEQMRGMRMWRPRSDQHSEAGARVTRGNERMPTAHH